MFRCHKTYPGPMRFFHVPSVYPTVFHVPLRYIERYCMYSIVYLKVPCGRLCIRHHYYRFEFPCTLCISRDPTRIPYPTEKNPLVVLFGAIHREQHSRRLLRTYLKYITSCTCLTILVRDQLF